MANYADPELWVSRRAYEEVCRERDMLRRELSTLKTPKVTETHENSPMPQPRGFTAMDWLNSKD